MAALFSNDPDLSATGAITRQFTGFIKGPLNKLFELNRDPLVIVIDTLNEMATDDNHRRLIVIFHEMPTLLP